MFDIEVVILFGVDVLLLFMLFILFYVLKLVLLLLLLFFGKNNLFVVDGFWVRGVDGGGNLIVCWWSGEVEELDVMGVVVGGCEGGVDEEVGIEDVLLEEVIFFVVVESLFVKDEMV